MSTTQNTPIRVKTRVQNKYDTKENFDKASFIPLKGEIVFYDVDGTLANRKMKVGDGETPIGELPFIAPTNIGASPSSHSHNDTYYTESEIDSKVTISGTVTKAIGGISKDKTYTNAALVDVLSDLLFPYVAPVFSSITTTATSGTFEYGTSRTISKVTPNFTKGSKNITSIKIGTTDGGSELYSGTSATSGSAITLTTSKTYNGTSGGTIYCTISDGTSTVKKNTSVSYTYYDYSKLTTSTTPDTSEATKQTTSGADNTYSYSAGQYLWLYSRSSGKKIQTYVAGSWADVTTTSYGSITLTLASGATATYYAYRTDKFTATGSARYRLA
jgi:hypothetical protein